MIRLIGNLLLVAVIFNLLPLSAFSATLYLDPQERELKLGDTTVVSVRINPDKDQCINAIDITIRYDQDIELVDVSRGRSIISVWIKEPLIDKDQRKIRIEGGIPNGYCGRLPGDPRHTNRLIDLVFSVPGFRVGGAESDGLARIEFETNSRVLLNDGFGTDAKVNFVNSDIRILNDIGGRDGNPWIDLVREDNIPPESFSIYLDRSENAFGNKYFISFNTTDKQSGLSHFEVMEEPIEYFNLFRWGEADAPWIRTESPYVLKDQTLNSIIRVKAVDKAGNEYIATLVPDEALRTRPTMEMVSYLTIVFVFIILIIVGFFALLWYRRRRPAFPSVKEDKVDEVEGIDKVDGLDDEEIDSEEKIDDLENKEGKN